MAIEIKDSDFDKMKWNFNLLSPSSSITKIFPDLGAIFSEYKNIRTDNLTNEQILRYIVLCYHRNSPFYNKIENLMERKREVMNYLKAMVLDDGLYPNDIQLILRSVDATVGKAIVHFCKFENSLLYLAFSQTMEAYLGLLDQFTVKTTSNKESKDIQDMILKMGQVEQRLDSLSIKLFQQDKLQADFVPAFLIEESRKKKVIPEDWAT